jgi:hypothetical protein
MDKKPACAKSFADSYMEEENSEKMNKASLELYAYEICVSIFILYFILFPTMEFRE